MPHHARQATPCPLSHAHRTSCISDAACGNENGERGRISSPPPDAPGQQATTRETPILLRCCFVGVTGLEPEGVALNEPKPSNPLLLKQESLYHSRQVTAQALFKSLQ
ncbi:hypothetical protein L345_15474, partial [Ophiophagus hannah]